ncbi:MAG: NADP-dependent oxidoreductase [Flavobacteriaceae bacterium]
MKAILLEKTGGTENLLLGEIDQPEPKSKEVLIQVKAIGINPVDYKVRAIEPALDMIYGTQRPAILGWDISGVVVSVGEEVSQFEVGDKVFGMVNFPGNGNAYAEFVAAPQDHLTKIPADLSFEDAAATTLAALTALQVLVPNVKKGDRVLIHAGSGGVGHFAIQIAKALGAYVITTSSARNRDFVLSLGADEHIDYRAQAFEEVVSDIDFVFDMFNGEILLNSVKAIKEGGTIISIPSADFSEEILTLAKQKGVSVSQILVQSSGEDMRTLKSMIEKGTLKPYVSQSFKFTDMAKAHEQLESGRTVGKVVVSL